MVGRTEMSVSQVKSQSAGGRGRVARAAAESAEDTFVELFHDMMRNGGKSVASQTGQGVPEVSRIETPEREAEVKAEQAVVKEQPKEEAVVEAKAETAKEEVEDETEIDESPEETPMQGAPQQNKEEAAVQQEVKKAEKSEEKAEVKQQGNAEVKQQGQAEVKQQGQAEVKQQGKAEVKLQGEQQQTQQAVIEQERAVVETVQAAAKKEVVAAAEETVEAAPETAVQAKERAVTEMSAAPAEHVQKVENNTAAMSEPVEKEVQAKNKPERAEKPVSSRPVEQVVAAVPGKPKEVENEQPAQVVQPVAATVQTNVNPAQHFQHRDVAASRSETASQRLSITPGAERSQRDVIPGQAFASQAPVERKAAANTKQANGKEKLPGSEQAKVVEQIQKMLEDATKTRSGNSITIHLNPAELGEVTVKVSQRGDQVFARIVPESKDVEQTLRANMHEIMQALSTSGVKSENMHIMIGETPETPFYGFNQSLENGHYRSGREFASSKNGSASTQTGMPAESATTSGAAQSGWVA